MHKITIVLAVILACLVFAVWDMASAPNQQAQMNKQRDIAPNFTITDINGEQHTLVELQGKTVFINFWATWCTPCVKEMPDLFALAEREKNTLIFLPISVDQDANKIKAFFKKYKLDITPENIIIGHDPKLQVSSLFGAHMFPESFIITPRGKIKHHVIGVTDWLGSDIKHILQKE